MNGHVVLLLTAAGVAFVGLLRQLYLIWKHRPKKALEAKGKGK